MSLCAKKDGDWKEREPGEMLGDFASRPQAV